MDTVIDAMSTHNHVGAWFAHIEKSGGDAGGGSLGGQTIVGGQGGVDGVGERGGGAKGGVGGDEGRCVKRKDILSGLRYDDVDSSLARDVRDIAVFQHE